jgi:hypothetical protein
MACHGKSFGNKGGLDRHTREVHGSQAYTCPVLSCKRNRRPFHRKYNLFEHRKRVHSFQTSGFLRTSSETLDEMSENEEGSQMPRSEDDEALDGRNVNGTDVDRDGGSGNSDASLRSKLRDLKIMRAEIDKDIMSLQRALRIMDGASP